MNMQSDLDCFHLRVVHLGDESETTSVSQTQISQSQTEVHRVQVHPVTEPRPFHIVEHVCNLCAVVSPGRSRQLVPLGAGRKLHGVSNISVDVSRTAGSLHV